MKKTIRLVALLLILVLSLSSTAFAQADPNEEAIERDNQIQALLDKRAALFLEEDIEIKELNRIDKALKSLGVEFLTADEAKAQFAPKKTMDPRLAPDNSEITPQVDVPYATNVQWMSYRTSNYYSGGEYYNIQRLIASPNQYDSNLKEIGTRIITLDYNWEAGVLAVFESAAWSGIGSIPGASLFVSVYDTVSSGISGISRTTEVNVPHITYSWSQATTASFAYVRKENESDDYQWLSYISTKVVAAVGYQIPSFEYENTDGQWVVVPTVTQGSRTIYATPSGYDSIYSAVMAYRDPYSYPSRATVDYIDISGPENKEVETIWPVSPQFPAHIYLERSLS